MDIRRLTAQETAEVYRAHLVQDFPPDELKSLAVIRAFEAQGDYFCTGLFDGDHMRAYAFFVCTGKGRSPAVLLDYYAVLPPFRGQGIGSAYLQRMPGLFPHADTIIIETEDPAHAETTEDKAVRERRIRFYLRAGCTETGVSAMMFGVPFRILQLPVSCAYGSDRMADAYTALYRSILPPELFRTQVAVTAAELAGELRLIPASAEDAVRIHAIQREAFLPLYLRYQDHDTNPAAEPVSRVAARLASPETDYYIIRCGEQDAGTVRVVRAEAGTVCRISPICILPSYQNRGLAHRVIGMLFALYPDAVSWCLSAIKEEPGSCRLYEQCGFVRTGTETALLPSMTLVDYRRSTAPADGTE